MKQLFLPLAQAPSYTLENFYISASNQDAFTALGRDWVSHKLIIAGPEGAGKSHLAAIWAHQKGAPIIAASELDEVQLYALKADYVVVENVTPGLGAKFETALFHLHNLLARPQGGLLITSQSAPSAWEIALGDLQSRLMAAELISLPPPDDALLRAVLAKSFSERQIIVAPNIIEYIVKRIERSLSAVRVLVEALDRSGQESGQAITLKSARDFFESPPPARL